MAEYGSLVDCSLAAKLKFLSAPSAYGCRSASVGLVETHMSYVFLVGDRAYKLKKPVRYPFLDFSTLQARERNCREEVRLNRRLAKGVYLGVVALTLDPVQGFALNGSGQVVEWLVEMRRLPAKLMLDSILQSGQPSAAQVGDICRTLAAFYRGAEPSQITAQDYVTRFLREQALNRDVLTRPDFARVHGCMSVVLDELDARLAVDRAWLEARVRMGAVVDGHGDLRPEHICLTEPIAIFDCLEFNAELRQVDPFDEIALLGVECAQLGAPQLMRQLAASLGDELGRAVPWRLVSLYGAWRATLRARLSLSHLLEASPRQPAKWAPLAGRYLDLAQRALALDIEVGSKERRDDFF